MAAARRRQWGKRESCMAMMQPLQEQQQPWHSPLLQATCRRCTPCALLWSTSSQAAPLQTPLPPLLLLSMPLRLLSLLPPRPSSPMTPSRRCCASRAASSHALQLQARLWWTCLQAHRHLHTRTPTPIPIRTVTKAKASQSMQLQRWHAAATPRARSSLPTSTQHPPQAHPQRRRAFAVPHPLRRQRAPSGWHM